MAELTPLSSWLYTLPERTVATRRGISVKTQDFRLQIQSWIAALQSKPGQRWAVYHSDAYNFLAILFALWQLRRTACVPGDNRAGTVQRLINHVDGFIGEFPVEEAVVGKAEIRSMNKQWIQLEPDFPAVEIYTSGSTGEPKSIGKTIAQLEREIEALEQQWPGDRSSVVLATVSHQHMYGMTFRLLWPLSVGRPFERELCEYTEDISHVAKNYTSFSLVTSPSHLGRVNTSINWRDAADRCEYLISSAAPLSRADSLNASQIFAADVREIYGSSETGAIAWRCQQETDIDALWRPLPGVELNPTEEHTLSVISPYLDSVYALELPDRVEFNSKGEFKLIGRIDRIVKVEGKRVSLASIENLLLDHPAVKNVRALTFEHKRVETAVVIQLTPAGDKQLHALESKGLIKVLKGMLAEHFEAVVLPRRWRFVNQLPYNSQGKLPLSALQGLFDDTLIRWPRIEHRELVGNQLTLKCNIPAELEYFEGHFPDNPILPGIVQIHWAVAYGQKYLSVTGIFNSLEVIKFSHVITTNTEVIISLQYDMAKSKLSFQYESNKGIHSSGRICFRK